MIISGYIEIYHEHAGAYEGYIVVVLVVQRDTESRPAGGPRQHSVVTVAGRKHQLSERTEASGGRPVPPGVEVCVEKEDVELRFILDCALQPSELLLQLFRRLRDQLPRDLEQEDNIRVSILSATLNGVSWTNICGFLGELSCADDSCDDADDRHAEKYTMRVC